MGKRKEFIKLDRETIEQLHDLTLAEIVAYKLVASYTKIYGVYDQPLSHVAYWLRTSDITARRVMHHLVELGLLEENIVQGKNTQYRNLPCEVTLDMPTEPLSNCYPSQNDTPLKMIGVTPYLKNHIDNNFLNENYRESNRESEKTDCKKKQFRKPTPEEVQAYCDERQNGISGSEFCDFYESKGWVVGKSPMKDWKAAVRTWENKRKQENKHDNTNPNTSTSAGNNTGAEKGKPYSRIQELGDTEFSLE